LLYSFDLVSVGTKLNKITIIRFQNNYMCSPKKLKSGTDEKVLRRQVQIKYLNPLPLLSKTRSKRQILRTTKKGRKSLTIMHHRGVQQPMTREYNRDQQAGQLPIKQYYNIQLICRGGPIGVGHIIPPFLFQIEKLMGCSRMDIQSIFLFIC
jgi:hypothetical protein